jgi:hypothetical protein
MPIYQSLNMAKCVRVFDVALLAGRNPATDFKVEYRPNLLGGVTVLRHRGVLLDASADGGALYSPLRSETRKPGAEVDLTFIPYYAWANRQPSAMRVWIPYLNGNGGRAAQGGR